MSTKTKNWKLQRMIKMSRIIDRRNQAMGGQANNRNVSAIRRIGIHHFAGPSTQTTATVEPHWRNLGWTRGGYHEVILANGDVEINYNPETQVNGVGDHNADSYHISLPGDFRTNQPTAAQQRVLLERIRFNVNRFPNVTFDRVLGHNEFPNTARFNHRSNSCPSMNMNNIRRDARQAPTPAPNPTPPTNNNNGDTFVVTTRTGGFNTAADARANRNRRNWVDPDTYHVFNRAKGMVNVTSTQGTPGSWINPTGQSQTTTNNAPSVTELARQVIAGQWGNGQDRINRLTRAGHNALTVQQEVNRLLR